MELGTQGPLAPECTACAASNMAIGDGLDAIRLGRADVMFCGGTEAPVTRVGIAGFGAMRALSRRNDDPKRGSRPFDAERDGFVMGEAGAMLVLEELEHAQARGAKIYAELLGYGVSSDATHVSDPDPTGENPARAMQMAFADAGIAPEQVGYVNAHGTSTPSGDSAETRVLKLALGEEHAYADARLLDEGRDRALPRRGRRGGGDLHDLRASSAACFRRRSTTRCPTRRATSTTSRTRRGAQKIEIGVSNSFGFGGHNACVVFRRWDES